MADEDEKNTQQPPVQTNDVVAQIAEKIGAAESVLIALKKDPTLDELAAAIGFCHIIDKLGKHGTAIFSGKVPTALEFLNPEDTLEKSTSSLQDFIIALSKDKADHLRYKVEGDYVKIFITPYKTSITEKDLEYSHGDYNVDLVIALDVAEANQLDAALAEYGRILHNASTVNITTGVPGKFADLEWANPAASSVSEMLVQLTDKLGNNVIDKDDATALLAGIIAATDGFRSKKATADTFMRSSELINAGADQAVIAENISKKDEPETPAEIDEHGGMTVNQEYEEPSGEEQPEEKVEEPSEPEDPTQLSIRHKDTPKAPIIDEKDVKPFAESVVEDAPATEGTSVDQLNSMVDTEKAKYDVPGPMAAEMSSEPAAPTPDASVDYTKQMENELNDWVSDDGDKPVEAEVVSDDNPEPVAEPVAENETVADETVVPETDAPESDDGNERTYVQGNDDGAYVINKPQTVIEPLSSGNVGIPPVAPLSEVTQALDGQPEIEPVAPVAPMPAEVAQPAENSDDLLPPPPPPPIPDANAFQLPEM